MRTYPVRFMLKLMVTGSLAATLSAEPQSKQASGDFEQRLRSQYVLAQTNRVKNQVSTSGTVVVIRQSGLNAAPPAPLNYINTFKDGQRRSGAGLRESVWQNAGTLRPIQMGERFYVTKLEVKDNAMIFFLASCEQTAGMYYWAGVSFQFSKGYQTSIDFDRMQQTISHVFTIEGPNKDSQPKAEASSASSRVAQPRGSGQAAPAGSFSEQSEPASFAPIAPPPEPEANRTKQDTPGRGMAQAGGLAVTSPPASTASGAAAPTLKLGLTIDEVAGVLGSPKNIVDLGEKKIHVYQDLKIIFTSGKVSDVQ